MCDVGLINLLSKCMEAHTAEKMIHHLRVTQQIERIYQIKLASNIFVVFVMVVSFVKEEDDNESGITMNTKDDHKVSALIHRGVASS